MIAFSSPWIDKASVVEAVGNNARGVPQNDAALFDGDATTELRGLGGQFRSSKPLVGRRHALVPRSFDGSIAYNRVDRMVV